MAPLGVRPTLVAQAKAEERRAAAVAREQEMKALVEENRAKVVLAEAEVPLAISQAFREGHMGIMDYYSMRNVQADTSMRNAIAGTSADITGMLGADMSSAPCFTCCTRSASLPSCSDG